MLKTHAPTAPEGYRTVSAFCYYTGRHGMSDHRPLYLAVPSELYVPYMDYSDAPYGDNETMPIRPCPPMGTLIYKKGEFVPFDVENNQELIEASNET